MSLSTFLLSNSNLILQTSVALSLALILSLFKIPLLFLHGLHTYVHFDDVNPTNKSPHGHGIRIMLRRLGNLDDDLKPRKKSKGRIEFDENKAQIFRVKLNDGHFQTKVYFNDFYGCFNFTIVAISCLLLHNCLSVSRDSGALANGSIVPFLFGSVGICRLFILIAKLSFERSASKRLERQIGFIFGFGGFLFGLVIGSEIFPQEILDFKLDALDGFVKFSISVFMGCIVGFLYKPALRSARAFWLGTDQIRCNLSVISCGWIGRLLLYVNYLLIVFTFLLWINPFAVFFVDNNIGNGKGAMLIRNAEQLVGNVGMPRLDFEKFRLLCLSVSGFLQIVTLQQNVQLYLNEAVLCWYQRIHASKVPDLDYNRAKSCLHNHYVCLVVLQFFVPPAMVLLFLGLSQIDDVLFLESVYSFLPSSVLVKEVTLFMAWWIAFVWAIFTSGSLALYRHGILCVS